jgi:hypothetical protein
MGVSTNASIAYGVDLEEELPEVIQRWLDEGDDRDTEEWLAHTSGWVPVPGDDGYYLQDANGVSSWQYVEEHCPVELVYHCSDDYPMYIIAVRGSEITASRGYPKVIGSLDVDEVKLEEATEWMAQHLPDIEWKPEWLLYSMWG